MNLSQATYVFRKIFRLGFPAAGSLLKRRLSGLTRRLLKRQRRVSYGRENPDKTFYVIGLEYDPSTGLTWLLFLFFLHIVYAVERAYIPVVDMQNFESNFSDSKLLRKKNVWDYFFEQPAGYTLADISRSKNIILSSPCHFRPGAKSIGPSLLDKFNRPRLLELRKLFQKYIRPALTVRKYFDSEYKTLIGNKTKILGVLCRGTDYAASKPSGHQIQPEPQAILEKAREVMRRKKCSHIYLATEDKDIYDLFKTQFGKKLLTNKQHRFRPDKKQKGKLIHQFSTLPAKEKYKMNLAYLSSLYILAKCSYFIGGRAGGTIAVYLMTKGFEYEYTWDLGLYP